MSHSRIVHGPGFRIRYDDKPGYLRAHVFDGTDSQAVSIAMWRMLAAECRAVDADRLLVLEELDASVGQSDVAPVVEAMAEAGYARIRVAFVELLDDIEGSEYGEILCRERGMTIRVFGNENAARRWLLYDD